MWQSYAGSEAQRCQSICPRRRHVRSASQNSCMGLPPGSSTSRIKSRHFQPLTLFECFIYICCVLWAFLFHRCAELCLYAQGCLQGRSCHASSCDQSESANLWRPVGDSQCSPIRFASTLALMGSRAREAKEGSKARRRQRCGKHWVERPLGDS